jgi:hypothetical protein
MINQSTPKYVIKVGEIGYFKYSKKSQIQIVVRNLTGCTYFESRTQANDLKTQFSLNPAILKRGIKLEIITIEESIPIEA